MWTAKVKQNFGTVVNYTTLKGLKRLKIFADCFDTVVNYTTLITPFGVFYVNYHTP